MYYPGMWPYASEKFFLCRLIQGLYHFKAISVVLKVPTLPIHEPFRPHNTEAKREICYNLLVLLVCSFSVPTFPVTASQDNLHDLYHSTHSRYPLLTQVHPGDAVPELRNAALLLLQNTMGQVIRFAVAIEITSDRDRLRDAILFILNELRRINPIFDSSQRRNLPQVLTDPQILSTDGNRDFRNFWPRPDRDPRECSCVHAMSYIGISSSIVETGRLCNLLVQLFELVACDSVSTNPPVWDYNLNHPHRTAAAMDAADAIVRCLASRCPFSTKSLHRDP